MKGKQITFSFILFLFSCNDGYQESPESSEEVIVGADRRKIVLDSIVSVAEKHYGDRNVKLANKHLNIVIRLIDDTTGQFHYMRGTTRLELDSFQSAIDDYRDAISKNFREGDSHYNLGICFTRLKKFEQAIDEFRQAYSINPEETNALFQINLLEKLISVQRSHGIDTISVQSQ